MIDQILIRSAMLSLYICPDCPYPYPHQLAFLSGNVIDKISYIDGGLNYYTKRN